MKVSILVVGGNVSIHMYIVTNLKLSNCIFINFVEVGNFYSLTLGLFWQNASFAHFGHFHPGIGTNGLIGPTLAQLEEMMSGIITSI